MKVFLSHKQNSKKQAWSVKWLGARVKLDGKWTAIDSWTLCKGIIQSVDPKFKGIVKLADGSACSEFENPEAEMVCVLGILPYLLLLLLHC